MYPQPETRAERIEEYKGIIDEEIDRLRDLRETERDAKRWLKLDADIDRLIEQRENAAAEIDGALAELVTRELAPKMLRQSGTLPQFEDLGTHSAIVGGVSSPEWWDEQKERSY